MNFERPYLLQLCCSDPVIETVHGSAIEKTLVNKQATTTAKQWNG